jgi:hypothetical protein
MVLLRCRMGLHLKLKVRQTIACLRHDLALMTGDLIF